MKILGKHSTRNEDGRTSTTLHVADAFPDYYNNPEKGRICVGQRVDSIYVGDYDTTAIKPGMEVEIYYDKAVPTKTGFFQPVKRIEIVKQ